MARTNLGELAVDIVADIGRLRSGLTQGIQLINRFSQQATRSAQAFGTGFQRSAQQVQTGSKFMGREFNRFAVTMAGASGKVKKAVEGQRDATKKAAEGVKDVGAAARKTKPKMDEFAGGILNITRNMGKWIAFNLSWFLTWRLMWTALRWVKAGVSAIIDFDTAITNLGAITGATQAQLISLEDTARGVGATTRFTAVQVAEAMVDLSKAGFSVAEVNQMIAGTALLAIGTLSDMTQTTQLVATTLRTFHLQASEAARIANVFAAAITSSRLTIESLRNSMKYIGPIMAEMGYSIEDTAAVLGVLADRGLEAGISARGLRGFFSALIAPTDKLRRELASVGLSVRDVSPLMNDLADILSRLQEANFDVESAMRGLERRVGTTAIALISAGKYFEVLRDAVTATTAAQVIAERQMGSLGYRLILLRSQATELALDFRDVFLPAIRGLLGGISALIVAIDALTSRMVELLNILPPLARELVIFGGIFTAITLAIGIFSGGVVKGVGLLTLFAIGLKGVGAALLKVIGFLGPWGLAIIAVGIGVTVLVSRLKKAQEATTTFRKEVAASLVDLSKQRTELARVGIALEEYRDDEIGLRTALEGLADIYPEIRTLLMKEIVTYEDAIAIVNKLTESKTEEARVRREELIKAIDAEIEAKTREIDKIEELAERIRKAWPVWKQLLQIWHLIRFGTLDSAKAMKELETKVRELESSKRALTITTRGVKKEFIEYTGAIEMTAKELLELAKIQKASAAELLPLYDAAIAKQGEMREMAALVLRDELNALTTRKQAQVEWSDAMEDPAIEKAYKTWVKASKELTKLEMERAEIMYEVFNNLRNIEEAEAKLFDAVHKRVLTEEEYYTMVLSLMKAKQGLLINTAEIEEKWTKENAKIFIETQQKALEAFHKLLDLRLQAALTANKEEAQAIEEVQSTFNQWYPLFEKIAAKFYDEMQRMGKIDKAWFEEFKGRQEKFLKGWEEGFEVTIEGVFRLWERELEKIRKAYEEYNLAMLEFDINVGRERREVLITEMKIRLNDEKYWEGKTYEARLAFEGTIVKLYRTTNKEIIAEAKTLAEIEISLGMQVLTERLLQLKKEAAAYPVLVNEILEAMRKLVPGLTKIYQDAREARIKAESVTLEEIIKLAGREYQKKIEYVEAWLASLKFLEAQGIDVAKEREMALAALANLRFLQNKATMDKTRELEDALFEYRRKLGTKTLEEEIKRQAEITRTRLATGAKTEEAINAQIELYELLAQQEEKLVKLALKRGESNAQIYARLMALWREYAEELGMSAAEVTRFISGRWEDLKEDFKLVGDTMEERWDVAMNRMKARIETWFTDIHLIFESLGEIVGSFLEQWSEGLSEALVLWVKQTEDMEKVWQKMWQRLVAYALDQLLKLLAMAIVKFILKLFGLGGGGEVKATAAAGALKGGEIGKLSKGGMISAIEQAVTQRIAQMQEGGEVLIRAHLGEYVIPEWMTDYIKKTRSVPGELVEAIGAGKPPKRYQAGGEVERGAGAMYQTISVTFMPGSRFTAEDKASTRAWFENELWPLQQEMVRRT